MSKKRHLVAVSGGKDSTAMALLLQEREPRDYEFCITPTGRELPAMQAHWERIECLLGKKLIKVPGPSMLDLIKHKKAMPNHRMRWCTVDIKIKPFMKYAINAVPAVCYVGIRADEADDRQGTNWKGIEGVEQDLPLVRFGYNLAKVTAYLEEKGIKIPPRTDCDCCFFQRLGEWWRLWREYPDRWAEIEALEHWTGHTLRSENKDTWPGGLKGLREKFEQGYVPKGADQLDFEFNVGSRKTMCSWCAR